VKLVLALEQLLSALSRGDAGESERLMNETAPLFASDARELSPDELGRAMELHQRCSAAALVLRQKTLDELGERSRGRRAAQLYRARR
jgi:hypothetical protein